MANGKKKTLDVWDLTKDLNGIIAEHTRMLLENYKTMRGIYGEPNKALMDAVLEMWPQGDKKFFEIFDMWLGTEMKIFDQNLEQLINDYAKDIDTIKYTAPNIEHYWMLVGEHTKLWLSNYRRLKERRENIFMESMDTVRKMIPSAMHPVLDNVSQWVASQNELLEREVLRRIEKLQVDIEEQKD